VCIPRAHARAFVRRNVGAFISHFVTPPLPYVITYGIPYTGMDREPRELATPYNNSAVGSERAIDNPSRAVAR